ncbi:unnamed protein product [Prunus brigantina]
MEVEVSPKGNSKLQHSGSMRLIGNGNLAQHLYPGGLEEGACKLTLRERISVAIDIANGLEYLQEGCPVQVIHCDLKPENVLVNTNMVAQVADFGIGKPISADKMEEYLSTTGSLRGSIGYIPPEYGQGVEVSAKGDVYSFGVVLLEMFTRKRPTSNMFSDGLDLRKWVGSAFPDQIWDVVDTTLKQEASSKDACDDLEKLEQCSIQLLEVKQFHPDVNRTGKDCDMMIRRVIQAYEMLSNYSRSEIIERECVDPFDNPECEAFDVFINEVLCIGKGCPYSCVQRAPHAFTYASNGTARAASPGVGDDYQVQLAVGQCPRSCIHYVTPLQRIILEELLDSILNMPYDSSAEADLLYSLIVKARFENNRYRKPKKQPKASTQHVDWF